MNFRRFLITAVLVAAGAFAHADLFVSSFSQHSVRRYDDTGAFLGTFIGARRARSAEFHDLRGP